MGEKHKNLNGVLVKWKRKIFDEISQFNKACEQCGMESLRFYPYVGWKTTRFNRKPKKKVRLAKGSKT